MGYLNGKDVLPAELLEKVQRYVQGRTIYIPRAGVSPVRRRASDIGTRNAEMRRKYAAGIPARQLAEEYFLSVQAVYKILADARK